jgi:hypothetical protein
LKMQGKKKSTIDALLAMESEPRALLKAAIDAIKTHTSAGSVYAANVADIEELDWVAPEGEEEQVDSDVESPEGGAPPEEPPAEEAAPVAEGSEEAGGEAAPKPAVRIDYTKKYFSYVAASEGQENVVGVSLRRPIAVGGEGDEEEVAAVKPAYTFRMLDEKIPLLVVPNVVQESTVTFFRRFPKIGSYLACGIQVSSGEFKSVLAVDTLMPEGNGQPLSTEDQDFIWEVSKAVAKAWEASQAKIIAPAADGPGPAAYANLNALITALKNPPPSGALHALLSI